MVFDYLLQFLFPLRRNFVLVLSQCTDTDTIMYWNCVLNGMESDSSYLAAIRTFDSWRSWVCFAVLSGALY